MESRQARRIEEEVVSDIDQYIVWIDKDTRLIEFAEYTVRKQFKFVKAAIHFAEYRDVQGVMVPFRMTITSEPKVATSIIGTDKYLHEMRLENVVFDTIASTALYPHIEVGYISDADIAR